MSLKDFPNLSNVLKRKSLKRKDERNGVPFSIGIVAGSTGRITVQVGYDKVKYKTHMEATKVIGLILEEAVKVARQPEALSRKD